MIRFYLIFCFILLLSSLKAQELKIDHDFGDQGITGFSFPDSYLQGYKVEQTKDGAYLTINYIYNTKTNKTGFSLTRIAKNGDIDRTFANSGQFEYYTEHPEYPADFVMLPNGKIALAFTDDKGKIDLVVLDKNGIVSENIILSPFPNHYLIPVRLMYREGYLFIGGIYQSISLNNELMFIMKLSIDGKFDKSFGEKGIFISENIIELNAKFQDMTFQNNDIIVYAAGNGDLSDHVFLYRINEDGTGDLNFAEGGILFIKSDNNSGFGTIKTDKSENIYFVPFDYPKVIKISPDGKPVQNYGMNGVAIDDYFIDKIYNSFFSILQDDNSVMIFGNQKSDKDKVSPVIIRYNDLGKRDENFGLKGLFSKSPEVNGSYLNGCFDQDNKLVIIGSYIDSVSGNQKSFLTRYEVHYTGIDDAPEIQTLEIYPNPIKRDNVFILTTNEHPPLSFAIYDLFGRKQSSGKVKQTNSGELCIDIDKYISNGFYFLFIWCYNYSVSTKIFLER